MDYIELKALEVKNQIERELAIITSEDLRHFLNNALKDKRAISFINFYNRTVLDREKISFGEFKHQWAIQGMKRYIYMYFEENFASLKEEILEKKDIKKFFNKYCREERNESAFCCKLFHTILPNEFPPLDNPIKKHFKLQNIDFLEALFIVKKAYLFFIQDNNDKMELIRKTFSGPKFKIFRVYELSDLRILDMYYWLKISRNKTKTNK